MIAKKKEKYQFLGGWGTREYVGKIVIKVEDINTHEFRGHFEEEEFNYVFQYKDVKRITEKKCRCYINFKYYAKQAKIGGAGMKNYKPCPVHEDCTKPKPIKEPEYKNTPSEDK